MEAPMGVVPCTDQAMWDAFVAGAGGGLLQSWRWGEFRRSQGWDVLRLMVLADEAPMGRRSPRGAAQVLVRTIAPLGSFLYAAEGPVLAAAEWENGAPALAPLLDTIQARGRARGALTLRVDPLTGVRSVAETLAAHGLRRASDNVQPEATAVVDLQPSEDELLAGLEKGARYLVRHAGRKGARMRIGTEGDIPTLARMIFETGQRKGFGIRHEAYLRALYRALSPYGLADLIVVEVKGATVASMIGAGYGSRYCSLYAAGNELGRKIGAQYLLHWEGMMQGKRRGCTLYDFRGVGAATGDDQLAGLTFFKSRFGTRREDFPGAWDHVYRPLSYNLFTRARWLRGATLKRARHFRRESSADSSDTVERGVRGHER